MRPRDQRWLIVVLFAATVAAWGLYALLRYPRTPVPQYVPTAGPVIVLAEPTMTPTVALPAAATPTALPLVIDLRPTQTATAPVLVLPEPTPSPAVSTRVPATMTQKG